MINDATQAKIVKALRELAEARKMGAGNGGQLNPTWVEVLMGWPPRWTDLAPLGKMEAGEAESPALQAG